MAEKIRVLYVDDESALLNLGKLFLEQKGDFTVTTAISATDAIRLLEQEGFDAVVSDYQMPGMDGIQFLVLVRTRFGQIPFILFTGKGREEVVIQAINSGADFYLQKGGDPQSQFAELAHKIKQAASRKRAEEALRESEERHRIILDEFSDPIFSFYPDGTYRHVNRAFAEGVGKSVDQIIGRKIWDVFPKDEAEKRFSVLRTVFSTGEGNEIEVRIPHPDGDRYYVTTIVPVKDESGSVLSAICSSKDITERKRVEEAIRESETRFDQLAKQSNTVTWEVDARGLYTYVSHVSEAVWGYRPDELVGRMHYYDLHPESGREAFKTATLAIFERKEPFRNLENSIQVRDGREVWVSTNGIPLLNADGTLQGYRGSDTDITERKRAEEVLMESEERFRKIIRSMQSGMVIIDAQTHTILDANDKALEMIGGSNDVIVGSVCHRFICPAELGRCPVTDLGLTVDSSERVLLNLLGKKIPIIKSVIKTTLGGKDVLIESFVDISGCKRAEERLQESEERYRNVVEDQTEFICRFLPDGTHIFVNDAYCRYFNMKREEIIGHRFRPALHPEDREIVARHLVSLTPEHPVMDIDQRIIIPDGSLKWQRWSDRAIFGENGRVVEYQSVGRDITERKQAEETLRQNESKFHTVADFTANWEYWLGQDRQLIYVSPSCERITGYTVQEFLADPHLLETIVHPNDLCSVQEHNSAEWESRDVLSIDFRIIRRDGTERWIEHTCQRVSDESGTPLGRRVSNRDNTELKRMERMIKESEQSFRELFNTVREAIYVMDVDGRFLEVNQGGLDMYGQPRDFFIGQSPDVLYTPDSFDMHQTINRLEKAFNREPQNFEITGRRSDGEIFPAECRLYRGYYFGQDVIIGLVIDITERKRAEEELQESENLFRSVGDSLLDPVLILSGEGLVQFANRAAIQFIGLPDTAIIRGQSFTTYIDGDSRNRVITDLHTIQELGGPLTAEYCVNLLKGEQRWVEACGVRIDYKGSHATLVTLRDITERIRVEEQLRESERRLADIINFLPDATLVIDINGTVLAWNRTIEEMTGVPAEQMIGKANYEYALPFYHERRPITVDLVLHDDPAVVAKYPVMHKEGRSRRSEIFIPHFNKGRGAHLWFTASPLYDAAGNITGAIESIRDITDRKRAEERLQESEERYRNVVEDQTEFICRFLPDGTHIFVNDAYCRYFNMKREEIIGHRFRPALHPEDREIVAQHLASLTPEHPVMDIDQRIIIPDGSLKWQRWSDRAIFGENGRVVEYQSVGRDITERKQAEEALRLANKKLTLLSRITRHDIKNQLTVILGYVDILENKQFDPTISEYFQMVATAANQISAIIRFTREYEKVGVTAPVWQDCRILVDTTAKDAPLGQVMVKNDLPAGAEVFTDPLIVKVIYNLMDNAVRYGGKITTIRFSVEESGDDHLIVCEDDGMGVTAEEKEKIFDRGFGKNTGLGLALSREILTLTGITIQETGEPGKGARFEMTVPKGMWRMTGTDRRKV